VALEDGAVAAAGVGRPVVRIGRGPRAVEHALLAALDGWSERVSRDVALLERPLRIVVPSRSLRDHVIGAALRSRGRPLVGVSVQTLHSLALELLERAGETTRTGRSLYSIVVRRLLEAEPALRGPLGGLSDAHRVVEATVNDLLDAGFAVEHHDAFVEALEGAEVAAAFRERASAIARIALRARDELSAAEFVHRSQLLERAVDALEHEPDVLRTSGVHVHGFAEATGRATDLLLAVARSAPTTFHVDEPGEPGAPATLDAGAVFAARLRERVEGLAAGAMSEQASALAGSPSNEPEPEDVVESPRELLVAPGAEAEVRAVAGRIRALLDADPALEPERVGVVARQLQPHAHALRAHFERLGIPWSGVGATVASGAAGRRGSALAALLDEAQECPADRWVELVRGFPGDADARALRADLRLGLRHLGAGRLRDVAQLRAVERDVALPVRRAVRPSDDEGSDDSDAGRPIARRRLLARGIVTRAIESAISCCARLEDVPTRAAAASWDSWLSLLLGDGLGWAGDEVSELVGPGLSSELPPGFELSREEAMSLLAERLRSHDASVPLGGKGGGVAVLGVMEARARTFDHLFLVGLNREVFPRPIREDPLLPDSLRLSLRAVLPDLPVKGSGHDEERYLFAQLVASGLEVVLSWQRTSDDGRDRVRSTFIDRLCGRRPDLEPLGVPALHHADLLDQPGGATARELAICAGIGASREQYEALLAPALRECEAGVRGSQGEAGERLARARVAVGREYSRFGGSSLGPYMGMLGPVSSTADLRTATHYVTSLEAMARCPWQAALQRLLRLEAPPDPLESFPELDTLTLGNTVHAALGDWFDPRAGERESRRLGEVSVADARNVSWPGEAPLRELAERCAREQLDRQGFPFEGLVRVLADRVVAQVERARELWATASVAVLGAEVAGELEVADGSTRHALAFRADLVERSGGAIVLSDFKSGAPMKGRTGGPIHGYAKPETRLGHFAAIVARGRALQAVAYALASGGSSDIGRYAFLDPEIDADFDTQPCFARSDEHAPRLEAAFQSAVRTLASGWDAGVFPPRLTEPEVDQQPQACGYCDLRSACLQGDTGQRQRQREWVAAASERGELSGIESQYLSVWQLPVATGELEDEAS